MDKQISIRGYEKKKNTDQERKCNQNTLVIFPGLHSHVHKFLEPSTVRCDRLVCSLMFTNLPAICRIQMEKIKELQCTEISKCNLFHLLLYYSPFLFSPLITDLKRCRQSSKIKQNKVMSRNY